MRMNPIFELYISSMNPIQFQAKNIDATIEIEKKMRKLRIKCK